MVICVSIVKYTKSTILNNSFAWEIDGMPYGSKPISNELIIMLVLYAK